MAGSMVSSPSSKGSERSPLLIAAKGLATYEPSRFGDERGEALPVLAHKYTIESKLVSSYQKLESTRRVSSTYGTLVLNQSEEVRSINVYDLTKRSLEDVSADPALASQNQSETESDSDGSCGLAATHPQPIQSILRIRSNDITCRTLEKKASSVGFAIDINDTDDEDDEFQVNKVVKQKQAQKQGRSRGRSCSARCIPRRLTLEEKAELYRVRPDLELTPMPVLLRDAEEMRRRRQRKLVFSLLGGTLILLMMVVMYYVFSQA